ncbi:carbapenem antibiotics biosynthesis protein carD [Verticillium alfalfae VaMs.102]|uniref:Proline dehydrogenase n=1 Tax=Verticillium alfalfae (strain VaMs.102 / ATCC MYA-4576 / FGSC 10136) TaxID=526221 RepID=C9SDR6_VERA1|nr:carbapenem antibiotics biosynthesis protein carD [Verticillium alfalfae VaMs.102]EEY17186.1 carbapenem antibiotics biosynthesis protein carD [Verticillium alfalfae VaMs.102]
MSSLYVAPRRLGAPLSRAFNKNEPRRFISNMLNTPESHHALMSAPPAAEPPALSRMPTTTLIRSLLLTSCMSSEWIMRPSLAIMNLIVKSKSPLLNPDKNPILNKILRWTIYDQFCAGTNRQEVARSVAEFKKFGYQGIILNHAKEIVLSADAAKAIEAEGEKQYAPECYEMITKWKEGTLSTLPMLEKGDFLALKLTGAGPIAVDALRAQKPIPAAIQSALDEICHATAAQGSHLWIDAEQQVLQPGVDEWTIALMRKHNAGLSAPLVFNTIQAYLKASKANTDRHIRLAAAEGWAVGIKLVRGAYIEHETRSLIHDTKEETDAMFDDIADMLLTQRMPDGCAPDAKFPAAALFLATHNGPSTMLALKTQMKRVRAGLPTARLECGQLVGMADELSCELVQNYEKCTREGTMSAAEVPKAFKYMAWGSVSECLGYLHRRAIENKGAVERTHQMVDALRKELWRRVVG